MDGCSASAGLPAVEPAPTRLANAHAQLAVTATCAAAAVVAPKAASPRRVPFALTQRIFGAIAASPVVAASQPVCEIVAQPCAGAMPCEGRALTLFAVNVLKSPQSAHGRCCKVQRTAQHPSSRGTAMHRAACWLARGAVYDRVLTHRGIAAGLTKHALYTQRGHADA
eukprot:scaffold19192_cov67-Phaeocystis_antarctica.AAC.2